MCSTNIFLIWKKEKIMQFTSTTVLSFFESSQKSYEIPVYQRAYSWEEEQWKTFLDDIIEQLNGENNYFYGNILLEIVEKNKVYEIIDGQQRLTTLTIFMRSILNIIKEHVDDNILENIDIVEKEKTFIKNKGNIKIRPVQYDRACYDSIIVDNEKYTCTTPSQKRYENAKQYFINRLKKYSVQKLLNIINKIENTELTYIELQGKKDSALMFELQNNRGKDLTNMERLKSYFMYQMYTYSPREEIDTNIEYISNMFEQIYIILNDIKTDEDSVLIYHNNAYLNGYSYRNLDDIKNSLKKSQEKIKWVKQYINDLRDSFQNIKKFEKENIEYAEKLNRLGIPAYAYAFILKAYKYFDENSNELNEMFQLLEKVVFCDKLINSRAKIEDRLNTILLTFKGDLKSLSSNIKNKLDESSYWSFTNIFSCLYGNMYKNNVLNYLLWEYERHIQNKGYKIRNMKLEKEGIEHISPQTPTDGNPLASGYDVDENNQYSEDFIDKTLNSLGNLMLISGSHNSKIGNKPFSEKLKSYQDNPLLNQQMEIKDFVINENEWKKKSIDTRKYSILAFATKRWEIE